MKRKVILFILLSFLVIVLGSCRNETQNQIRRSIQDFTAARMYVTIYSLDGSVVFEGQVDGKVTRSTTSSSNSNSPAEGSYIYWFDEQGRYHQTDMPYLVTSYDRRSE
ncbi:MAG: hypothetical protein KC422_12035 [Trueperaceae bacterium]|nr:hypothetical protein [Trueperaceae bacterium]